jgi:hypothetical protein
MRTSIPLGNEASAAGSQGFGEFLGEGTLRTVSAAPFVALLAATRWPVDRLAGGRGCGRRSRHRSACGRRTSVGSLCTGLSSGMSGGVSTSVRPGVARTVFPGVLSGWVPHMPAASAHGRTGRPLTFGLRRLRGIGPQQTVFQRSAVESADDGVHLLRVRRFDKREAFRLLRLGIADHFNCVRDQVFGLKPSLDVVRGYPGGQVAQKNGKAHSRIVFSSIGGGVRSGGLP